VLAVRRDGRKLKPLIVFKGISNERVSEEVRNNYDDNISLHTAQAKAWTDEERESIGVETFGVEQ